MSNPLQHSPAGEHPEGFHPSQWWDVLQSAGEAKRVYSRYLRRGDLVFDIGANLGQRTAWFRELGCRVVAVEPIAAMARHITTEATVVVAAAGAQAGEQPFYICSSSPYLSTLSTDYVDAVYEQPGIGGNIYQPPVMVPVVTLDDLIAEHGEPAFVKIDVEGGELGVLQGLSRPLPALSFEVHAFAPGKGDACIERLQELAGGAYHFDYSRLETFLLESWPPRDGLAVFGDVYAVLKP